MTRRGSRAARRLVVALGAGALVLGSCLEATAVRVHVYTDVAWEDGRRVVIAASSGDAPSSSEPLAKVTGPWASPDLGDFVLLPSKSRSAPVRLAVVMGITKDARECRAEAPEGCIFARRRLAFLEHRTLTLPVTMYATCIGVPCTADTTCNALGQCVSADVDPSACASGECSLEGEAPPTSLRPPGANDAGGGDAGEVGGGDAGGDVMPKDLAAGAMHSCRRFVDGTVKCWGHNANGQLGLGDATHRGDKPGGMGDALSFVDLGAGRSARALAAAAGGAHTCALLDNGRVKCWGYNVYGELGLGDATTRGDKPGQMGDALAFVDLGAGHSARALVAGGGHTCALLDNDRVKCWGYNVYGELGLGDITNRGDKPGQMGDALPFVDLGK